MEVLAGVILGILIVIAEYFGFFWNPSRGLSFSFNEFVYLNILVVLGAFVAANFTKKFALKFPTKRELIKGIIGAFFLATGAILALGGNIGGFFVPFVNFSASALLFLLGMLFGMYTGVRLEVKEIDANLTQRGIQVRFPKLNYVFGVLGLILTAFLVKYHLVLGIFFLIGIFLYLGRWCFWNAFREPFFSTKLTSSLGIAIATLVAIAGIAVLKFKSLLPVGFGVPPAFDWETLIGGLLFGAGMGLCGAGSESILWKTGEGDLKLLVVSLVFAVVYSAESFGLKSLHIRIIGEKVALSKVLGSPLIAGALSVILVLLWLGVLLYNRKTKKLVKRYF